VSAPRKSLLNKPLVGYLSSVAAITLALIVREALAFLTGPDFPEYVLFYPTVMTIALLLGIWPALISILAATGLLILARSITWLRSYTPADSSSYLGLGLFVGVCVFLSIVAEMYRRNRVKAEAYDREQVLRQSQEALRRQAELLRLSFDAIIVWKMGGEIESWNKGAEELYGFSESEARGRDIHGLLKTTLDRPWPEFELMLRESGRWHGEVRHRARDGREVVVSSRLHIGGESDGQERVLEIDRDITEQKRVQEELQRAHDELEEKVQRRTTDLQKANRTLLMVSACDQALVQISEERELISVICQIIQDEGGYPLVWVGLMGGELEGSITCVAAAGDRAGFLDSMRTTGGTAAVADWPLAQAVRSGEPVVIDDISADGTAAPWRKEALKKGFLGIAALPLVSKRKTVFGVLVIYSDSAASFKESQLTLLKELVDDLAFGVMSLRARAERDQAQRDLELKAEQLRILTEEIVRAEQHERQRIARLLHDQFQQLLAAALYGVAALKAGASEDELRDGTAKLNGLLRECIALSRSLSSELGHPALSDPDLRAGLEWLAVWMMEKHGLQVFIKAGEAVIVQAEETRTMLLQAIRELLFNVVKHSGVKTAHVDMGRSAESKVTITVTDEGAGFDPQTLFKLDGATSGVGLFSIRERLALAGGGLDIASVPGRGSRFTFWVPDIPEAQGIESGAPRAATMAQPEDAAPQRRPAAGTSKSDRKLRVFLVDDHALVREGLALQIRQQPDMEIVGEAADGEAAVRLVGSLRPDVVTMDLNMPGMDGIEAARRIHSAFPDVKIIGLSMFEEPRQAAAMREAGAESYLSKTASVDTLLAAIRERKNTPQQTASRGGRL